MSGLGQEANFSDLAFRAGCVIVTCWCSISSHCCIDDSKLDPSLFCVVDVHVFIETRDSRGFIFIFLFFFFTTVTAIYASNELLMTDGKVLVAN